MKSEAKVAIIILIAIGVAVILYSSTTNTGPHSRQIPVLTFDKELACQTDSDCQLTDTDCCNNNAPKQNACINRDTIADWKQRLTSYCASSKVGCPEFFMLGNYSCACEHQVCTTTVTNNEGGFSYSGIIGPGE